MEEDAALTIFTIPQLRSYDHEYIAMSFHIAILCYGRNLESASLF